MMVWMEYCLHAGLNVSNPENIRNELGDTQWETYMQSLPCFTNQPPTDKAQLTFFHSFVYGSLLCPAGLENDRLHCNWPHIFSL